MIGGRGFGSALQLIRFESQVRSAAVADWLQYGTMAGKLRIRTLARAGNGMKPLSAEAWRGSERQWADPAGDRSPHAERPTGATRAKSGEPLPTECDPRWQAVVRRDASADGQFFYSVRTTGVYCRPGCAARRANPANVRFHPTAADAERAGFRACRRCRPDLPGLEQRQAALVAALCRAIESADEPPSLAALAEAHGVSASHLHRMFRALTGLSPRQFALAHRRARVRQQLAGAVSITDAIYGAGFGSSSRFYESAAAMLGMTPRAYRSGGNGVEIHFALGQCSLGAILVAQSAIGICAILLGDDPEALVRDLEDRFPRAHLIGGQPEYETLVASVVGLVENPSLGLDLPLDIRGTALQQRVWEALRKIPAGATVTYADLARQIGRPRAARAVAAACAANPLAVAIPCHRVIRRDGSLAGYRWGLVRKRLLLEREAEPANSGQGSHASGPRSTR